MIDFDVFDDALVAVVEEVEAQRIADAARKRKAAQRAEERERRRINASNARRAAEIEQQRIDDNADWERSERIRKKLDLAKEERLKDEAAKEEANKSLFMFTMVEKKTFLAAFEKIKSAAEIQVSRDPRGGELLVAWMRKKGMTVNSISDAFRVLERNCLRKLADDFIERRDMSPKAKRYFWVWVSPFLLPKPRTDIDEIKDLFRSMTNARGGQGNQGLASALLPKLMTDISPGLQAHPEQNFMMAYQPQIAHIQVNQYDPRRDLEHVKNMAAAIGYAPQSQSRERVQDRKINEVVENILKSMGPSARARRGPDGSLMIYWPVDDHG